MPLASRTIVGSIVFLLRLYTMLSLVSWANLNSRSTCKADLAELLAKNTYLSDLGVILS